MKRIVRIGCGAGFWGDSPDGSRRLVEEGGIDYLVLDYLAEITMSILARMKAKNPELGYATDFVTLVMKPLAREIAERRIKVVTNAGGVNPEACRAPSKLSSKRRASTSRSRWCSGDDLSGQIEDFKRRGVPRDVQRRAVPRASATSVNAYLGAFPIAAALGAGADIVITGRCVDSAIVLGPLIHEFGWTHTDYDLLAVGSLAGHIIECGAQATGGVFTDWREVQGWDQMGFPIAECAADGAFVVTKPERSGGLVTPATIAEQIVYEVGDPSAYILPDVVCDWSQVRLGGGRGQSGSRPSAREAQRHRQPIRSAPPMPTAIAPRSP